MVLCNQKTNMKNFQTKFYSAALLLPFQIERPVDWPQRFGRRAPLEVEIGAGLGEHIVRLAEKARETDFVAIENDWQRAAKILKKIARQNLKNIKVLPTDARLVFERLIVPSSVQRIHCLFPCPWPKKRHAKHRLFTQEFFQLLNSRLTSDGNVHIVTDHFSYTEWIKEELAQTGFELQEQIIAPQFNTKFERKWLESGQTAFFEMFLYKREHLDRPIKRDVVLREGILDFFNPDILKNKLKTKSVNSDQNIPVILKEFLFDPQQEKGKVRALVVEKDIEQHLWIEISRREEGWMIFPSSSSPFIPTPGIQKAIDLVLAHAKDH